jgi:hypothetical protein
MLAPCRSVREEPGTTGVALKSNFIEYLILFDLKSHAEQVFCFCCLRNLIALCEPAEDIVKFFGDTDVYAFLGSGHMNGVYQKCIYFVKQR